MKRTNGSPLPGMTKIELLGALSQYFSDTDSRVILRQFSDDDFGNTLMNQAVKIYQIIKESDTMSISIAKLAQILNVDRGNLNRKINKNIQNKPGHPSYLTEDQEEELILYIQLRCEDHKPMTPKDIDDYILNNFNIEVSPSWHNHFVERHHDKICTTVAYPQEKGRVSLTKQEGELHIDHLIKYIEGVPTELVFNIDEVGIQKWYEKKNKRIIAPIALKNTRIEYPVERSEKRISIVCAISMAGDTLTPMFITHRKTIYKEIQGTGIREGEDLILEYQPKSYINNSLFSKYIDDVILKYVKEVRKNELYRDEPAVILCDNCTSHLDDKLLQKLAENNIRLITIPPHSSHIFQPLDLVTFGVFKKEMLRATSKYESGSILDRIARALKSIEKATISENNRSSFEIAGLNIDFSTNPERVIINEDFIREKMEKYGFIDNPNYEYQGQFGFVNKDHFNYFLFQPF